MRGVCLYFVAQCAFVPTRSVLAKCFSACLLISMVCSAVFLGLIGWIGLARPTGVFFVWEVISAVRGLILPLDRTPLRGRQSCCVSPLSGGVFFVFAIVLLWLTRSAPWLPRFIGLVGSFFDFELPIRQVELWTAYYRLLFLSASCVVAPRFLLFSWLIAVFYFGCWRTFDCVFVCFSSVFRVLRNICRFLLRLIRVVCFCNKC